MNVTPTRKEEKGEDLGKRRNTQNIGTVFNYLRMEHQ